ncbi:NUDIX domain-containing protein, partial [Mesorhizobium japonicum]|uniref:NUDIX domain-containing protein n=1 Tax=Mesorhizobium japonicum TaxID=2066070 RepID=UPI003B5CE880
MSETGRRSAGLLLHRRGADGVEVWIAHMGGPFWARKEERAWSVPKGEREPGDPDDLAVARREFAEEIGTPAPPGEPIALGEFRYASGKVVAVFALEAPDFDPAEVVSDTFELEWPPRSGRRQAFPEVDRAAWVPLP